MEKQFKAFVINNQGENFSAGTNLLPFEQLPQSDVLIEVHYSSVNYKDGLASIPKSTIVKKYPFIVFRREDSFLKSRKSLGGR